jgi:hypothetical protein
MTSVTRLPTSATPDVDLSSYPLPVQEAFRRLLLPGLADEIILDGEGSFAALYERVSDPRLEQGYSLDHQRLDGLVEAHSNGWRVRRGDVFRETHSGEDIYERPLLSILRERARHGLVQAVVYPRDDRFARDAAWLELVIREHWHFQVEVRVVGSGDDFTDDSPLGYLLRAAKGYKSKQVCWADVFKAAGPYACYRTPVLLSLERGGGTWVADRTVASAERTNFKCVRTCPPGAHAGG